MSLLRRHALMTRRSIGTFRDVLLSTSPLSYHPMGDASGTMCVALAGANGTYQGSPTLGRPKLLPGDIATSMGTSLTNNRMVMAQTLSGTGPFTLCIALRYTIGTPQMLLLDQNVGGGGDPRTFLALNRSGSTGADITAGAIEFFNFDGSTNRGVRVVDAGLNDGQAHLVVFGRVDPSTPFVDIDGVPQTLTGPGMSSGDIISGGQWGVGQSIVTSALPYSGDVGHFASWNRALTLAERQDLFLASGL